ncbi:hypothetical protein Egran_05529 [Elaphomyces granulatus]|uniref:HTH myb-type domain-containing protein n=1 Tax=Elaphomyces granulatus TaxID=519963 RepID=A0A232LRJ1_9EURO|nr:hypothetical protein Egran_05529 [Elaphomyces granulatus]
MVSTRGSKLSSDAKASSAFLVPDANASEKVSHPIDDDSSSLFSRAYKKRRTGSGPEVLPALSQPKPGIDGTPDNQIEEELASALNRAVGESLENLNGIIHGHGDGSTDSHSAPMENRDPYGATFISDIMDHAERVEGQFALSQQLEDGTAQTSSKGLTFIKASSHLKIQSLPILDNLSTQILSLLAKSSYQDITSFVSEPESENGQAYATMRSLFDHTKRVYSTRKAFLSPMELDLTQPLQVDIIRKANLASFMSSIFGTQEIGFSELNDHFLDVFVAEGSRLLKVQGALFLELKTQAFIASMNNTERSRTELLYDLFPDDMEHRLLARRPGTRQLAPSEVDFVKRANSRREILLNDVNNEDAIKALPDKYHWEDFLRDLSTYISRNFDAINQSTKKATKTRYSTSNGEAHRPQTAPLESQFSVAPQTPEAAVDRRTHGDLVARAARAAQIALQGQGIRRSQQSQQPRQGTQPASQFPQSTPATQEIGETPPRPASSQLSFQQSQTPPEFQAPTQLTFQQSPLQAALQQYNSTSNAPVAARSDLPATNYGYMPGVPHYSQTQPTQVLYERARLAATSKSSASTRRAGLPSQRRPWTTEEENALMAGLDRVKGPHWSQILAMFGPGGTINESLKDRNQVQLKDKARNLKLFFLKSGIEVPYYLKFVTGELKTRAPAQAAKHEARERDKKRGEEDKAHVQGIEGMMALAGAHPSHAGPDHSPDSLTESPGLPQDGDSQSMLDQTADQNLIQTFDQEIHGDLLQQDHQHLDPIDPSMSMPELDERYGIGKMEDC